jgi:hypothetical protein
MNVFRQSVFDENLSEFANRDLKKNILGTRVMLAFSSANIKRLAPLMKFCRQIEIRQNQHI